ncbi:hypothetical protein MKX03_034288 [Papaver bracteatum]|nr:hypothetical protein MKX03_034288 [Papaver bracteatum]
MQRPGSATQIPPNKVLWGLVEDENCHKEILKPKFGDAVHKGVGARLTMISTEVKRPQPPDGPYLANHFGTSKSETHIPPGKRDGVKRLGSEMKPRRNEGNSVRVSKCLYTSKSDLLELFSDFGHVGHVSVDVDQKTGIIGGLVIFAKKDDANRAIRNLSARGYDRIFE